MRQSFDLHFHFGHIQRLHSLISLHLYFLDAEDDIQSVHEEVAPQIRGKIANITEFRPDLTDGVLRSEYSYNPVVATCSGKLVDQIWAGPSHWKLKFIRRSTAKFSGRDDAREKQTKRRKKKAVPEMIDFDREYEEFDMTKKLKIKRRPPTADYHKYEFFCYFI